MDMGNGLLETESTKKFHLEVELQGRKRKTLCLRQMAMGTIVQFIN